MNNRILFKSFSQCVFPEIKESLMQTFSIWSNGNFYYEYDDYDIPDNLDEELIYELLKNAKFKSKKKLIFKSQKLSKQIEEILNKYKNEILELPKEIHNYGILDGYTDHLQFGNKTLWGGNILTHLPYTRSRWFETADEEEKEIKLRLN